MKPGWRDLHGQSATCVRCLEVKDTSELDRLLWCERCRERARARAGRWGWGVAGAVTALLGLWVWLWVRPELLVGGWLGILAAALWLGARLSREVGYAAMRLRNRGAVEAVPPETAPEEPPAEETDTL